MSQLNVNTISPQSGSTVSFTGTISGSNLKLSGDVTAKRYIVSSSVTELSIITNSGSTAFGDTLDDTHIYTGSLQLTGSITASKFSGDGSGLSNVFEGTTPSASISTRLTSLTDGTATLISGSVTSTGSLGRLESTTLSVNTPLTSSTAIFTNNIQNGYPTSNRWQDNLVGSYFNNFDNTTHVSEILRFMAGVISHSIDTAAPTPNLKYWNTVSTSHTDGSTTSKGSLLNGVLGTSYENARLSQHWTGSSYIDGSTTGSYMKVQNYLELKGWLQSSDKGDFGNDTGTNPFHGSYASRIPSTILTNGTFGTNNFTISANAGGSSAIYSNSNYFGMGGLTNGSATAPAAGMIQMRYAHSSNTGSGNDTFRQHNPSNSDDGRLYANSDSRAYNTQFNIWEFEPA